MRGRRALLALAGLGLLACGQRDGGSISPGSDWERMIRQPRYDAYEPSDLFPDGLAMRVPPDGTVPRERPLGPPELVEGTGAGGAPVARFPLPLTPALLATGRHQFGILCATCHGAAGDGRSPVAEAMSLRKPPSLHEERIRRLPDGYLYRVVRDGYGLMPPYGGDLTVQQRWAVVAYLRALQLSRRAPVDVLPPPVRQQLDREAR